MSEHIGSICQICGCTLSSTDEADFYDKLTRWLDDHPEFTWIYFSRKANVPSNDLWPDAGLENERNPECDLSVFCSYKTPIPASVPSSPNISMPIRKISNQDFDCFDGQRILSASPDGKPTFMPPEFYSSMHPTLLTEEVRSPRKEVTNMTFPLPENESCPPISDELRLINELILDVCNELDITALCFKIIQNVCILLEADRGSVFLVDRDRITGENVLVSTLFDVTPECTLEDSLSRSDTRHIVIPIGVGVSGHVAQTGEYANIPDAYADPRFSDVVDRATGYRTNCLLCMPIKNIDGKVLAVALVINKRNRSKVLAATDPGPTTPCGSSEGSVFSDRDVRVFMSYVAFCGIGLHNAQIYQKSRLETYRNQVLLEIARIIFTENSDLCRLIYTVLDHTVSLLQCQRCQLLLVAEQDSTSDEIVHLEPTAVRFSHAYNLAWNANTDSEEWSNAEHSIEKSVFPVHFAIAESVVRTAETVNLPDAASDPRFNSTAEESLDPMWRTKTLLCVPIKHSDGRVLAVCFLVNKFIGNLKTKSVAVDWSAESTRSDWSGAFSAADESLFEAFALFAGLGISNRQMYERVVRSVAKQRVLLDVLSYHATAPKSEAKLLANSLIPSCRFYQLDAFSFTDISLTDEATLKASVRMFLEMRFMKSFKLDMLSLCRWILSVKKNYREVTYHNWRHAFNVTQTMFAVIMNADLQMVFSDLECLALLIACLSHDLDHRGTDNQFQIKTMSPLAQLYSTSVLEHHHFNQCMLLLSQKGNDFLSTLNRSDYRQVISLVREDILATDLSRYFARLPDFNRTLDDRRSRLDAVPTVSDPQVLWEPWLTHTEERSLLGYMLMTCCDISAITKPWPVQKVTAELVTAEFLEQGDLERDKLHTQPRDLMNRDQIHQLPSLQICFIDTVCLPVYKAIAQVSDALQPLLDGCLRNRECWVHLMEGRDVPESLFGLSQTTIRYGSQRFPVDSPPLARMGTINPTRIRRIVSSKPFESTPSRRMSTVSSTTVGGDQDLDQSAVASPSVE